jgi:hypothetical protein
MWDQAATGLRRRQLRRQQLPDHRLPAEAVVVDIQGEDARGAAIDAIDGWCAKRARATSLTTPRILGGPVREDGDPIGVIGAILTDGPTSLLVSIDADAVVRVAGNNDRFAVVTRAGRVEFAPDGMTVHLSGSSR